MAFNNVRTLTSIRSPLSSFKLLCVAANFSRPRFRPIWQTLIKMFVHKDEIEIRYWCVSRYQRMAIRVGELESDFLSALELCASDMYRIDESFHPDLVIDGGGNIGLFTLRAAGIEASTGRPPKFVIYEPLPHNCEQCERHLQINHVDAEMVRACLGGTHRSIPFYCREAINSSFDPSKPYDKVIDIPVHTLKDAIDKAPGAERILIKLDIEGMEVEALGALIPCENRPVYVVGELHDVSMRGPQLRKLFEDYDWCFEFDEIRDDQAIFRACSPAAFPLLPSMASATRTSKIH
ncbi:MAG: FkbM family methyltransferase [Acidobacteria bacterium]|nr:FkbM family methyltransferase [Acidobacteriota bacterium]